ncbi:MAG: N-acetylmuramoyl-L-alanine amidase, partial [Actinomycetota bacterium]|nr:N-acetylmuramoyl-L-alanine amidase [Actinomycetota bacterium]
ARAAGQYRGSTWYGASRYNYTNASRPPTINKIVIHVAQGSYWGTLNWFKDSRAQASAHYTVSSRYGSVGQSVSEADIAWHAGWWDYNKTSIGIEHEGYVSDPKWFTDAMYRSSAKLSAYLCKKYNIPIDRSHIIGHNEVPNATHTDPGGNWNWTTYMGYVAYYADAAAYSQVVDNTTTGRFNTGSTWDTSSYSAQKYGANYRFQKPSTTTNYASYKVNIPANGTYAIYGWWPANSGYNGATVFQVYTASGWVGRTVDQRINGGKWVALGTFSMNAGDDWWVRIPNRSSTAGYIIADAVKVVRSG